MMNEIVVLSLAGALLLTASTPEKGQLRAGAARVDITPAADAVLPLDGYGKSEQGSTGIHDHLYVRAIVVDDGTSQGAVVSCDLLFVEGEFWDKMVARLTKETGLSRESILMVATHTHGAPVVVGPIREEFKKRWTEWRAQLEDRVVEAVRQAKANLQPTRAGFGTGKAYVNTNRRARLASGGWGLGVNPEGPSDKTVRVVRFESLSGEPIAFLINYGVHGTCLGPENREITGDLPGLTERLVEQHFANKVVAAWSSAASGDQNPIYGPGKDYGPGGAFGRLSALGQILSEEVVRVAGTIQTSPNAKVRGAQKTVTCAGQRLAPGSDADGNKVSFLDAPPVNIRVSLLMVNNIALTGVSAEVLTLIGERLKRESPFSHTLLLTHCNGSVGYIPDDAAYAQASYEVATSPVKPGCAESAIVNAALQLMDEY